MQFKASLLMKARKDPIKSGFDWDMVVYFKIPDRIQHKLHSSVPIIMDVSEQVLQSTLSQLKRYR
jgi:hypothetical protein